MTEIKRRGQRSLHVSRGNADRDPMADQMALAREMFGATWYGGQNPLPTSPPEGWVAPPPAPELITLPPLPPEQHNDHVMRYWQWRLDRLEAKRHG